MSNLGMLELLLIALAVYASYKAVALLYLSPLARIPGSKLAALTRWYEWYQDCVRPGQYSFVIQDMHKKYGDIVRIGPNEVHITDPEWFDTLYCSAAKLDKDPWFYGFMANEASAFSTSSYHEHRVKRSVVNPFFSKANVERSEPLLRKVLLNMLGVFDEAKGPVGLRNAFKSYSADVVCEFCFPEGSEYVKGKDFSATFHQGQEGFARALPSFRHFPILATMAINMPNFLIPWLPEDAKQAVHFIMYTEEQVKLVKANKESKRTIIREILDSSLQPEYRSTFVLEQEAQAFVAAGTATTSRALEETVFYILSNPEITAKLTAEVRAVDGDILTLKQLEQLPYLSATVLEALRAVPAVPSRFPRINRTEAMVYREYTLPPGTVIGMSPWDILRDPRAFSNPETFDPSRWMVAPEQKAKLQKYMVPFGRGSRNCVGQNLAMAELHMVLGNMFKRYDMELFDTTQKELTIVQDCFVPFQYRGSKGVRVNMRRV